MPTPPLPDAVYQQTVDEYQRALDSGLTPGGMPSPANAAAKAMGCGVDRFRRRLYRAQELGFKPGGKTKEPEPIPEPMLELPESQLDYDTLADRKKAKFDKMQRFEATRKLIPTKLPYKGNVFGIHAFGDLHLDDDGCDYGMAQDHATLVRENDGVFAISIGDHLNNWIGGLARKYASQSTTRAEGHILAEGFIKKEVGRGKWICLLGGNHDEWGTLKFFLDKIARDVGTRYIDAHAGIGINLPNGNDVRLRLAHQLPGGSIYNAAQPQTRDILFRYRWEITMSGHRHQSGYVTIKQEDTGCISHGVQLASYQIINHHAREKQFKDNHISPCGFFVVNGTLPNTHPDMVKLFWYPEEGIEWLKFLQKKHDK